MDRRVKMLVGSMLVLGAGFVAWQMWLLNQQELLWGYRPLLMLVFLLAGCGFIWDSGKKRTKTQQKWLLWSIAGGVLLWLGFVPMPVFPALFIAFVPILIVEREIHNEAGLAKRQVFKYALYSFLWWNALSTFWVLNTHLIAGLIAVGMNSLFMTIPIIGYHHIRHRLGERLGIIALVSFWICFEFIHLRWEISWPWLTLGNGFAHQPFLIQWYEYTGVFGGSLWILSINYFIFKSGRELKRLSVGLKLFMGLGMPLACSIVLGVMAKSESGKSVEAIMIQPNYEPHYKKFESIFEPEYITSYIKLIEEKITDETRYVVLPETSFWSISENDINQHPIISSLLKVLDDYPNCRLISGISSYKILDQNDKIDGPVHESRGRRYFTSNSGIQLQNGETDIPVYRKSKFVPGAESFPYSELLFFTAPLVNSLGGSIVGLRGQKERSVFKGEEGIAAASIICYESVYGEYCTDYVKKGGNLLFVITNDGWWDNTEGHIQHMHFSSLRAIETRRPVARSANTGISCFIDKTGKIISRTTYNEAVAIKGRMEIVDPSTQTFYVRYGDVIGRLAILLTSLILLFNIRLKIKGVSQKER